MCVYAVWRTLLITLLSNLDSDHATRGRVWAVGGQAASTRAEQGRAGCREWQGNRDKRRLVEAPGQARGS